MSKQVGIHRRRATTSGVLRTAVTVVAATGFVVSWSSGFLVPALAAADTSPVTLLLWRFIPLAMVLIIVVHVAGAARGVARAEVRRQAVIGAFAQFGYCTAVYAAVVAGVATGTTALIDAVQPLVVALLVGPLLGLRVRGAQWAGLVVGAIGVALVVRSQLDGSVAPPAAYLWLLLAMGCLIAATFLQRRWASGTGTLVTLTIHATATAVLLIPVAAISGGLVPPASVVFWVAVVFSAVFPTLAAYGLYWWLLRRIGITALNALLFLVAPTTAVIGALLLGEPLTGVTLIGFALCGAGVAAVLVSDVRGARERLVSDAKGTRERQVSDAGGTGERQVSDAEGAGAGRAGASSDSGDEEGMCS